MQKSLDRKLAAIHANPNSREFILADAKDADMAFGIGAPGRSPEAHSGELRFRTLQEYRDQIRAITRQGMVDIMLMSASTNHALAIDEKLFVDSHVTPAVRANDTTDVHLARGSRYAEEPSRPFRTASLDHIQCGKLDCAPSERSIGANLGLYSVTFNNSLDHDIRTLEQFHVFREEAERKGFHYFLEVFDPNVPGVIDPAKLPGYINDMIARMLAGVAPAGRPRFLKMVYHGPKAMEELFRYDPHLVIGVLGGGAGTTLDAFQLLFDAKKYGAKVALFGRKINNAENQLAFVHFLRLIADDVIGPVDAVKAYHAVLQRLGIRAQRSLDDDLKLQANLMSYGGSTSVAIPAAAPSGDAAACPCRSKPDKPAGGGCGCHGAEPHAHEARPLVTEAAGHKSTYGASTASPPSAYPRNANGFPDFPKMSPAQRLAYHRDRLGLGRI